MSREVSRFSHQAKQFHLNPLDVSKAVSGFKSKHDWVLWLTVLQADINNVSYFCRSVGMSRQAFYRSRARLISLGMWVAA